MHGYVMSGATQVLFNGLNALMQTGHCWSGISAFAGNVQFNSSATNAVSATASDKQGHGYGHWEVQVMPNTSSGLEVMHKCETNVLMY